MRRGSIGLLILLVLVLAGALAPAVLASDGKLEINQDCAAVGCFPGDNAGLPLEITVPGSYIFTGNLLWSGNGSAIIITANRVSLDLGGFTLRGDPNQMSSPIAILSGTEVEVSHGVITAFTAGISGSNAHRLELRDLTLTAINGTAISLGMTSEAQIRDSFISGNGAGIDAPGDRMMVVGCTVSGNTVGDGIRVGTRSLVADNIVIANGGDGIEVFDFSTVRGNVIHGQTANYGINLNGSTLVIGNTVVGNGIMMPFGNIEACGTCLLVDNLAP